MEKLFVLQQEVSDEDELSLFPRYMFSMNIFWWTILDK